MARTNSYFVVIMITLQTFFACCISVVGQYIYQFFLETFPDNPPQNGTNISSFASIVYESAQQTCGQNSTTTSNTSAEVWAQQRSADLSFRLTLWRAFPMIVVTYLFGLYASRLNRRLVLFISLLGNALHVVIIQAIIYKHLPEYWWYIASFIFGLAGGPNVLGILFNLIVTENTEEDERSSRFVRLGALATALSSVVTFGVGYYILWRGFTDLFWMAIGFQVLSMIVVILLYRPTYPSTTTDETTSLLSASNANVEVVTPTTSICYHCFDMCALFSCKQRSRKKIISLVLILVSYIFNLLAVSSSAPMLWYFLGEPFCWSSGDLGNYGAISLLTTAIFSVVGMKALSACGADDALICAVGHVCLFSYSLWIALARHSWQLYSALLINPFSMYQSVLTVSMVSKLLEGHERDSAFTLLTEISTIVGSFGSSLFNLIYAETVTYQKNFTLLLASGLCVVPFILNICLFIINRKMSDGPEATVVSEEDVAPTTFSPSNNVLTQGANVVCLVPPSLSLTNSLVISQHGRAHDDSYSTIDDQNDQHVIT